MLTGYEEASYRAPAPVLAAKRPMLTDPDVQVFSLDDAPPPSAVVVPAQPVIAARSPMLTTSPENAPIVSRAADVPPDVVAPLSAPLSDLPVADATPPVAVASYQGARNIRELRPDTPDMAEPPKGQSQEVPVDFEADNLQHDEAAQTITATGHVQLVQAGKILRANRMVYNLATDKVNAEGSVILSDTNGDVHFAEQLELTGQMRAGVVTKLQTYLGQGGRFTASEGTKMADGSMQLKDAAYTPCECDNGDDGEPAWQIKAKEVNYNEAEHRIKYKHAKFEIYGVPVMYTPYLAHSDGQEKQKSGLLAPGFGFSSQLGYHVTNQYYWAIAPHKDATMGVMLTTKKNPVALAEYRHRFENAEFTISGSATSSSRKDSVNGIETTRDEEARGHLFSSGRWDINNKWRAGLNMEVASDDQYMRQYDFSDDDILENQLYVERFSGRNYAVGRLLAFQDIRVQTERTDQPNILPEVVASFTGEPNATLGGRWHVEGSALGLMREGDGQNMNRTSLTGAWQRKFVSETGLVSTVDVSARGDFYQSSNTDIAAMTPGMDDTGSETRFFPQAHIVTSYPVAKPLEKMQVLIEPMVALTAAPNVNAEDSRIPNEDSQDAQIDALNLFNPDRFPGKDRIEDRSRVTYGVRTGLYGYGGSSLDVFAGQSYRFGEEDNPFPEGSGLNRQESDYVGQISGVYDGDFGANYRFQLASDDFSSQRHEFDGYANWDRFSLNSRYLYATSLEDTSIDEAREQAEAIASVNLTDRWRFNTGALYDLGEDPGLRKAAVGLDFMGCCMSFSVLAERSLTTDSSGDNGTDIKFRIGLDHLGQLESGSSSYWNDRTLTD